MLHIAAIAGLLALLWVVLSGYWIPWLLGAAAASIALTVFIGRRMGAIDREGYPLHLLERLALYLPWLLWEVVKSNVDVVRAIARPRMAIAPKLLVIDTDAATDLGRATYANSITLTPGTVTLRVDDRTLVVHALTQGGAEGLLEGAMNRRVAWVETGRAS